VNGVGWLLLDIGGVLEVVDDDAWPDQLAARWEKRFGLDAGDYRARITRLELPDATVRSGVAEEYWGMIANALGVGDDDRAAMVVEFWDAYCGHRNDPLLDYLSTRRGVSASGRICTSTPHRRSPRSSRRFPRATSLNPWQTRS
jgi:putative hydrolase of the HAD superfamily